MADFGSGYMKRLKKMAGLGGREMTPGEQLFANKPQQLLNWVDPATGEQLSDPNAPPPGDLSLSVGAPREVSDKLAFREPEVLPEVPVEKPLQVAMGTPTIVEDDPFAGVPWEPAEKYAPTSQHQPLPAPPGSLARIKGDDIPRSQHQPLTGDISRIKEARRPQAPLAVSPIGNSGQDITARTVGMDLASNRLAGAVPQPGQPPAMQHGQAPDEWAQGLRDAQGRAADSELMARLGELIDRAGSRFSRSRRVQPNTGYFRALAQDAQQPVTDFQQQYGMDRQKRADAAAAAAGQSKLAMLKERLAAEAAGRGETARHNLATEELARQAEANKGSRLDRAIAAKGARTDKVLAAQAKEAQRQREQALKADKEGAPVDASIQLAERMISALDPAASDEFLSGARTRELATTVGKEWGGLAGGLTQATAAKMGDTASKEAPRVAQALRALDAAAADFLKSKTGATATDTERETLMNIVKGARTHKDILFGLQLLKETRAKAQQRIAQAYPQAQPAVAQPGAAPPPSLAALDFVDSDSGEEFSFDSEDEAAEAMRERPSLRRVR